NRACPAFEMLQHVRKRSRRHTHFPQKHNGAQYLIQAPALHQPKRYIRRPDRKVTSTRKNADRYVAMPGHYTTPPKVYPMRAQGLSQPQINNKHQT
ncbi:hypothetical protein JI435_073500, partial [Parastagonospora nodorum SN15]